MGLTQVSTGGVKNDAITKAKIPANQIEASELADNAVDTNAIADDAITTAKIATSAITNTEIATGTISASRIVSGGLTAATLANDAITTDKVADNAITPAKINVPLTNRNLIINGAMNVAQRATTSTVNGFATLDRFKTSFTGTDESPTQEQADVAAGTTPYTSGFRKCFKLTNGNQTSGAGAGDRMEIQYMLEAQDVANSGWNYTSASSFITFSFWIKSSVAQEFFIRIQTQDGTQYRYKTGTGSLSADTWTKITKTIPGNSNLTFNNDNGGGLRISFYAFAGTNFSDSSATDTWAANETGNRTNDMTSTWFTTNNATFEITGVQLEVGSVATDFEHRSFGQELALCERYFEKSYSYSTVPGTATDAGLLMWLANRNPGLPHTSLRYKTPKRTNPTVVIFNTNTADSNTLRDKDTSTDLTPQVTRPGESGCTIHTNTSVALGNFIAFHYTAEAEL